MSTHLVHAHEVRLEAGQQADTFAQVALPDAREGGDVVLRQDLAQGSCCGSSSCGGGEGLGLCCRHGRFLGGLADSGAGSSSGGVPWPPPPR